MNRTIKQLIYGSLYLVILGLLGWGIYGLVKPTASCFDQKLNQDEEEVDCGGSNCQSCAIKRLKPIQTSPVQLFPIDEHILSLSFELINPNAAYGAEFTYDIVFDGAQGSESPTVTKRSFIYPAEVKTVVEAGIALPAALPAGASVSLRDLSWRPLAEFSAPRVVVRDVRVEVDGAAHEAAITGVVANQSSRFLPRVVLNAVISDGSGVAIGVSRTLVQDLAPSQERFFKIVVPAIYAAQISPDAVAFFIEAR